MCWWKGARARSPDQHLSLEVEREGRAELRAEHATAVGLGLEARAGVSDEAEDAIASGGADPHGMEGWTSPIARVEPNPTGMVRVGPVEVPPSYWKSVTAPPAGFPAKNVPSGDHADASPPATLACIETPPSASRATSSILTASFTNSGTLGVSSGEAPIDNTADPDCSASPASTVSSHNPVVPPTSRAWPRSPSHTTLVPRASAVVYADVM